MEDAGGKVDLDASDTPSSSPTVVCVLGMSRSGTSLTARVLSLAGVYLGPEEELLGGELAHLAGEGDEVIARARKANPEGFWEHYRLMRLNEGILKRLGGNWRDPPSMPQGWEASEEMAPAYDEARALLGESFDGRNLWAWKDPRNSLTLPFWQRLLPDMRYVICLRNPVDVARSLERRDGISLEDGVELWVAYVLAALVNTSGRPRLLVAYESYFNDRQAIVERLSRFVGRDGALGGAEADRALADEVIDDQLWRNRTAPAEVVETDWVSLEAASLYLITELLAIADVSTGRDQGDGLTELHGAVDAYAGRLRR